MKLRIILWYFFPLLVQFSGGFHHTFIPPWEGRSRGIPSQAARRGIDGEWIQSEQVTDWGKFGKEEFCPVGSFAIGFRVKYAEVGQDDDTGINGIGLICVFANGQPIQQNPSSTVGAFGRWQECRCPGEPFEAVVGHRLCVQESQGEHVDDISAYGLYLVCEKRRLFGCVHEYDIGPCSDAVVCPDEYPKICGIRTQVEERQWGEDDTSLNNVDFFCCKESLEEKEKQIKQLEDKIVDSDHKRTMALKTLDDCDTNIRVWKNQIHTLNFMKNAIKEKIQQYDGPPPAQRRRLNDDEPMETGRGLERRKLVPSMSTIVGSSGNTVANQGTIRDINNVTVGNRKPEVDISISSKMRTKNSEELAKKFCHYYEKVCERVRIMVNSHFEKEKIHNGAICGVLDMHEGRRNAEFKKLKNRPARVATPKMIRRVQKENKNNLGMSDSNLGYKLKISKLSLHDIKPTKLGVKSYRATPAPKYNQGQQKRAKPNSRQIAEKRVKQNMPVNLVMNDETNCSNDPDEVPARKYYSCTNQKTFKDSFKYTPKSKFPIKHIIGRALDSLGDVSKPFVTTMTSERYLNDCVKKILIPFINNRDEYAPYVPRARPIERFWALCKREYSRRTKPPKKLGRFRHIWTYTSKVVARKSGKALLGTARQIIRQIGRMGVYGPYEAKN
ncbi:Vitelline membrane outer layer protein 1 [Folsomia candida]|uniref:Vitelline membrane outer layer protein 1 n=1 Tax=Folsomia candida TaxID=158441 RepID=A0A226EW74_FOLCA|nr:Vitelline membrane outer layer protein 1 [Folsomia candida]